MSGDRRNDLNQYIQVKGEVRFAELEERFPQVSAMTLRRDLDFLEQQGQIIRIRGGAKSLALLSMIKEAVYIQRQAANPEAKQHIAEKAAGLVQPGASIYVDSGTTCMALAQRLPDQNLFVLTPAPNIALELIRNSSFKVNLTGGQLNRETLTLSGFNAAEYIRTLNIDLAFMAASAFSISAGFTCGDYFEAELKRLIIRKARQVVVLMDSSKLRGSLPYTFAKLGQIDILVSDAALPADIQRAMRKAHVQEL